MKAFTDINQSKKLAEILPIESADAWWAERYEGKVTNDGQYIVNEEPFYYISFIKPSEINYSQDTVKDIPCWSLAALLNYLREIDFFPEIDADKCEVTMNVNYYKEEEARLLSPIHNIKVKAENFIDACYELIVKWHEQKIL